MEIFELTNEQRKYFGLNPIENIWERVQWLETSYIFFDGNTIRKIIHYDPHPNFHTGYIEQDYDLPTENREFIKPKTDRGKLKKVTASNILAFKPINVSFNWTYRMVRVECVANSVVIAKTFDKECFETFDELEAWIKNFMSSVPENHFEQLQIVKQTPKPKKNKSYQQGDILAYQLEKNKFCFGQVLLDLWKIRNCGKFLEEKMLVQIGKFAMFGNPLIVRGFEFYSDSLKPNLDTLLKSNSSGGFYSNDYLIYNNICPIIGNRNVEEKDMLFPMVICKSKNSYFFQWGFIEKRIEIAPLKMLIKKINYEIREAGSVVYHSSIVTPNQQLLSEKIEEAVELKEFLTKNCFDIFKHIQWHTVDDFFNELKAELKNKLNAEIEENPNFIEDITKVTHKERGKSITKLILKFTYNGTKLQIVNDKANGFTLGNLGAGKWDYFTDKIAKIKFCDFSNKETFRIIDNDYRRKIIENMIKEINKHHEENYINLKRTCLTLVMKKLRE